MAESTSVKNIKTPWHLWVVGVLALLWNAAGAFDYFMTETRNASYMNSFTAGQLAYFDSIPKWAIATWALGVWGGVLGSVLLLFRRRLAVAVFAVSLVSAALTFLYNYVLSNGLEVMGGGIALLFAGVILLIAALLLWYARYMAKSGALR
ncbi:MAG: hypothetical protein ACM3KD_00290 [Hyphomicrobiaceae bacterium]